MKYKTNMTRAGICLKILTFERLNKDVRPAAAAAVGDSTGNIPVVYKYVKIVTDDDNTVTGACLADI